MARPCKYNDEVAERICEAIATTRQGLDLICSENQDFPSSRTFYRWLENNEELCQMYTRAHKVQAAKIFADIIKVADDDSNDLLMGEQGQYPNMAAIHRAKIKIDAYKFTSARLDPQKYGDKMDITSKDKEIGSLMLDLSGLSFEQLLALKNDNTGSDTASG